MTREDANFILTNIDRRVCDAELSEALDMAIKALSVEPDCISRQAVLTYIEFILTHGMGKKKSFEFIKKYVERQPSITQKQTDVLDNIRAEVAKDREWWYEVHGEDYAMPLDGALAIIDKYITERGKEE